MQISQDDVRKIAQLARLKLTDEEVVRFSGQLTDILSYVDLLKELDTAGVLETSQVTGLANVTRVDELRSEPLCTSDELLDCSPLSKKSHQIRIPRIL